MAKITVDTDTAVYIGGDVFYKDGKSHNVSNTFLNKQIADKLVIEGLITIDENFDLTGTPADIQDALFRYLNL